MKFNKVSRLIALVLSSALLFDITVFAKDEDRGVIVSSDTYVSSLNQNTGFYSDKKLNVSSDGTDKQNTYILFNVGNLPKGDDVRITLKLTVSDIAEAAYDETEGKPDSIVSLSGLKTHDWKQSKVTYTTVPAIGTAITTFIPEKGKTYELDVTDYVKSNTSKQGYISFCLTASDTTGNVYSFASKEAKTGKPELFIDVDYVAPPLQEEEKTVDQSSNTNIMSGKDYTKVTGLDEQTMKDHIEKPDMSGIPDDIYVEDFTTVRINKHLVNYVYGQPETVAKMLKGKLPAQMTYSLAVSPTNLNKILIGSDCQMIYRSEDGGKHSYISSEGLPSIGVSDLAFYPDDDNIAFAILAGYSNFNKKYADILGIYKSTDSGKTWVHKDSGIIRELKNFQMNCIAFGGKMENGIRPMYTIGTDGTGVWRSMDIGETWECIYEGVTGRYIEAYDNTVIFPAGNEGLAYSDDCGNTWTTETGNIKGKFMSGITSDPADRNHLISLTDDDDYNTKDGELWESFDRGKSWNRIAGRDDIMVNYIAGIMYGPLDVKTNSARLYLMSDRNNQVLRYSDDGGHTWNIPILDTPEARGSDGGYWAKPIAFSANYPDVVAVGIDNLAVSYDKGNSFAVRSYGRSGAKLQNVSTNPENPSEILFSHTDLGIVQTYPIGDEWYPLTAFDQMYRTGMPNPRTVYGALYDAANPKHIIAAFGSWSGYHTYCESWDGGFNYEIVKGGPRISATYRSFNHPQKNNVIYYGFHRSDDSGATWKELSRGVEAVAPSNGDIVYSIDAGKVWQSTDMGETWSEYSKTNSHKDRQMIVDAEDPERLYLGVTVNNFEIIDHKTVVRKGETDGLMPDPYSGIKITIDGISQDPKDPNHMVVGGRNIGGVNQPSGYIYESFDRGETFRAIPIPASADVTIVEFDETRPMVYFGSSSGTFVYEYENYDKQRPECYYTDTEGKFCEEEAKYLADNNIIGENAPNDYGRALELGIDRYVYDGDFLTLMLSTTDFVSDYTDVMFEDIDWEHRFYSQVQIGLENGLVLLSDGKDGKLNLLWKKLTHGMCAKYLARLLSVNGVKASVSSDEIDKFMTAGISAEDANAMAVMYKLGILTGDDGFEFSPEKEITRGEMAYMFARALKLYK